MSIKKQLHEIEVIGKLEVITEIGRTQSILIKVDNTDLFIGDGGRFTASGIKDYFYPLKNFKINDDGRINLIGLNDSAGKITLAKKDYNNIEGLFYGSSNNLIINNNKIYYYNSISQYFDDEIRDNLHSMLVNCSYQDFFNEYIKRDPGFMKSIENDLYPLAIKEDL